MSELTFRDFERISSAVWCLEISELASEMKFAYNAYNHFYRHKDAYNAEWYRAYYWSIRNRLVRECK